MRNFKTDIFSVAYRDGFLWKIMSGDDELVRMMYFALRDENWGTCPLILSDEDIITTEKSFCIKYSALNTAHGKPIYQWLVSISGEGDQIEFIITGTALTDLLKSRAGFCVHHPVKNLKGAPCQVTDFTGRVSKFTFPRHIAPENPFKNIKSMQYSVAGKGVRLAFEGDLFEMEDQRNWTDASFKTFCTPLDKPFPVLLKKGDTMQQRISIRIEVPAKSKITNSDCIELLSSGGQLVIPNIGAGAAAETLSPAIVEAIKKFTLAHYRIEVRASDVDWQHALRAQIANAIKLGLKVEIGYIHDGKAESFQNLCIIFKEFREISHVALFSEGPVTTPDMQAFTSALREVRNDVMIGAGTIFNFAELNRNRFDASVYDFLTFAIHPQEHSFDDLTILENVEAQYDAIETARNLYPGKEIHVSPLTLKKRYNPYATIRKKKKIAPAHQNDPRQHTRFASLFMLGSLKYLTRAGASSVTLFEVQGERGFISYDGTASDSYKWLQQLVNYRENLWDIQSSHVLLVDALIMKDSPTGKEYLVLWNYSHNCHKVSFEKKIFSIEPRGIICVEV